jgi:hypothetical protein
MDGMRSPACPGPDEPAGIPRRAARDPGLDRGAPSLGARAELLRRPFIACWPGITMRGSTAHIVEQGASQDVPVLVQADGP